MALESDEDATLVAGGTAVALMLGQRLISPRTIVSLQRLQGDEAGRWRRIAIHGGAVRLGAGATLTSVAEDPTVRRVLPSLAESARRVGNVRIRNVATIGGNLVHADYASDPPAVLASLGAECIAVSRQGVRTIPVSKFVVGFYSTALRRGEILQEIAVPLPHEQQRAVYLKYQSRSCEDRPCVGVAVTGRLDRGRMFGVRVVVGAVADTPQEVAEATRLLDGQAPERTLLEEAANLCGDRITTMDDHRGSSAYRKQMIRVYVRRALEAAFGAPS